MAKPAKKNQSRFGEAMSGFAPAGLAHGRTQAVEKPARRVAWTDIMVGALCLAIGFGAGLYLIKPHTANVAATVAPSASVATFGSASDVLRPTQVPAAASTSAATLQPGQTADEIQGIEVNVQPQSANVVFQGTVTGSQLQGSYNGPLATQ